MAGRLPSLQSVVDPAQALAPKVELEHRSGTVRTYGMTMWFNVTVPRLDGGAGALGWWSGCSGLEVNLTPEGPFDEGGNPVQARFLPGRIDYPKVVLERAMSAEGTTAVRSWLDSVVAEWGHGGAGRTPPAQTVEIELWSGLGRNDVLVHRWRLPDVVPVAWAAPALSTSGGGIAVERLSLVHSGFLRPGRVDYRVSMTELDEQTGQPDAGRRLSFLFNPAKVSFTKSREDHKVLSGMQSVDPNKLQITLTDLRLEGVGEIQQAGELLKRWVTLAEPATPAVTPPPANSDAPDICPACRQLKPGPKNPDGKPRVLEMDWGKGRSHLPGKLLLKTFTMHLIRFAADGSPSRATVDLTLQEQQ